MKTALDSAYSLELESISFCEEEGVLHAVLVELIQADEPSDVMVGDVLITDSYAVEATSKSRRFHLRFQSLATWQVVTEVLILPEMGDEGDTTGVLQIKTDSAYFEFVKTYHGCFESISSAGEFFHYQIYTEWRRLDVIAGEPPEIEVIP